MYGLYPDGEAASPHWLKINHNSLLPDLIISCEQDSAQGGDTITIDVILGSPISPVDSIYSLSLTLANTLFFVNGTDSVPVSNFGNPNLNLYSNFYYDPANHKVDFVASRQDHQNTSVYGDTISVFHFIVNSLPGMHILRAHYNAITKDGCEIPMNIVLDSIYINNTTGIKNPDVSQLKVFPNPADNEIYFSGIHENINQLLITDNTGRIIFKTENIKNNFRLNLSDYDAGLYYISYISNAGSSYSRFIVMH